MPRDEEYEPHGTIESAPVSELAWRVQFERVVHSDRAAVDIGLVALRTVVLMNAGAIVALMAFVAQSLGNEPVQYALVDRAGAFVCGLILGCFGGVIAYVYQSFRTEREEQILAQMSPVNRASVLSPTVVSRVCRWTALGMLALLALSLILFVYGALTTMNELASAT